MERIIKLISGKELLVQTGVSFFVRILGATSAFLLSLFIGRHLGAEEAGYYFLAFSIITFLAAFSRVGLDSTVLRFTGASFSDSHQKLVISVLNKSVILTIAVSGFFSAFLFIFSDFIATFFFVKPFLSPTLKGMSLGVIGLALFTLLAISLQGMERVAQSIFVISIAANMCLIIGLLILNIDSSIVLAYGYSIVSIVTVIIGFVLWRRSVQSINMPANKITKEEISWRELFNSCLPLWVVMIMSQLTLWSGQFIAGAWISTDELAQLAVAQRTAMLTSFILMAVNLVVAPRFAAMYKNGQLTEIRRLALTSVRLMILFALPIIAIMLTFPGFLMSLFGEDFTAGSHLLQILAIGQFINVSTGSVGFLLSMSGHEKDLRNTTLVSGPVAVVTALVLVPIYGATGSAIATALAIASQNLIAVFWVKKRLGFNTLAVWQKI